MADDPFSARRRLRGRRHVSPVARPGRHLELVTDRWIADLAELVVLRPRARREPDGRPRLPASEPDRDPQAGFGPSSRA